MRTIGKLVVGLAVAVCFGVTATSALAYAVWGHCSETGFATKYSEHQCEAAYGLGKWQWNEVQGTEAVVGHGSLVLADTKIPIVGTVEIQCTGKIEGSVGPQEYGRITRITEIKCAPGRNCEKITKETVPLNLPWITELRTEEPKRVRAKITNFMSGKEAPGWAATCKVLGIEKTDQCTTPSGSTSIENRSLNNELLILASFDQYSANAECTIGGAGAGTMRGPVVISQANGGGLGAFSN